jgi:hypothetical protein
MKAWISGAVAAVLVGGGIAAGTGVALADTGSTTTPAASTDKVCTERIPKALKRIDTLTARINGDASTRGSTAWLQAREEQARTAGHAALADLIQERIDDRPQKAQRLAALKSQLQDVQAKDCAS